MRPLNGTLLYLRMKLYAHQQELLDLNPPKYGIFDSMGLGKTITALALAEKNNAEMLIIVPKPVRQKWHDAQVSMGVEGRVMGREQFRLKARNLKRYDGIIIDEAHYGFGNTKSKLFKELMWYIKEHNIEYIWVLTGTPYASNPNNIYALAKILGHDWNYIKFRDKFFAERYLGFRMIWEPRTGIEEEMKRYINEIGRTMKLEDCFDVPEQIFEVEYYAPTKEQEAAIKLMKENESDPIVRIIKNHQIANGTLKGNEFEPTQYFAADKNDQIVSYAEEHPKLIVFCRYNAHLDLLHRILTQKGIPCRIINGSVKDKESIFREAEAAPRMVMLINSMVSVGYELPSFDLMIFASLSFSYVDYVQACGRILRANALKKNVYKVLITKGTLDEAVYASVKKKEDFSAELYNKEIS